MKRRAIEPAIKQINENSAASGFSVAMEEIKDSRAVSRVRFLVVKSQTRLEHEEALKPKDIKPAVANKNKSPLPTSAYEVAKKTAPGWDIYNLEQQWREWSTFTTE